jgi:hypothetical protein
MRGLIIIVNDVSDWLVYITLVGDEDEEVEEEDELLLQW